MKVDGLDIDAGVEGVLVEEDCTTCVMGHVEAIREKLVVNVVRRLLQGKDMPPSWNSCLEGIFLSATAPGFQLCMLSLLCTIERVANCLLKLFL